MKAAKKQSQFKANIKKEYRIKDTEYRRQKSEFSLRSSVLCSRSSRQVPTGTTSGGVHSTKHDNSGAFSGCLLPGVVPEILNLKQAFLIEHDLKNKANLPDAKMNVSFFFKKDYENNRDWALVGLSAMVNGIIHNEVVKIAAGSVLLLRLIDGSAMYLRS